MTSKDWVDFIEWAESQALRLCILAGAICTELLHDSVTVQHLPPTWQTAMHIFSIASMVIAGVSIRPWSGKRPATAPVDAANSPQQRKSDKP